MLPTSPEGVAWTLLLALICLLVGAVAGAYAAWRLTSPSTGQHGSDEEPLSEGLNRLHDQLRDLEHARISWQSQLHEQVGEVRRSTEALRHETHTLSTALRRPQVRGQWGELHLRRVVELAGMVAHCDFTEQGRLADGALRPDLIVHLAGDRSVVVDAKAPLDAFLDLAGSDDAQRELHLQRHAAACRRHIDALSAKSYWRELPRATEFVVMFLPAESLLAAATEHDPTLIEYAAARDIVLATPTTLIALLRTVAFGWREDTLAEQTRQVHHTAAELHRRLATLAGHFDRLGRSLHASVGHFNSAVGSYESRVLVQARRLQDLGASDVPVPEVSQVDRQPLRLATLDTGEADTSGHASHETEPAQARTDRRAGPA